MKTRKYKYYSADFETTVYDGQELTQVWLAGFCELYTENCHTFGCISDMFDAMINNNCNGVYYFHNLKFDGSFWIDYLLRDKKFKQAYTIEEDNILSINWLEEKDMPNNSFKYSISNKGQWYSIIIRVNDKFIELRDSLKLLPFSLDKIGKDFSLKHKKLTMEYEGFRYPNCPVSCDEMEYFKADLLVLKEALEFMFDQGHTSLTIGSCCLADFKNIIGDEWDNLFPDLRDYKLDKSKYGVENAHKYVLKTYKGGWCYVKGDKQGKVFTPKIENKFQTTRKPISGKTADVNSLYPFAMHSSSGNYYPIGLPTFWSGNYIPDQATKLNRYFFIRIKTRFKLKEGYLPFIQIKGNFLYNGKESLTTSDYYDKLTGEYYETYITKDGIKHDTYVTLSLTMTDYYRILDHYDLIECTILDGCYFFNAIGIFDEYINKWNTIKETSEGAMRALAKLFNNNLYGKLATSDDSSFKVAKLDEEGNIKFMSIPQNEKEPVYIPCGSAITSYARDYTIRHAQLNYDTFCYADTDSIHCLGNDIKDIEIHPTKLGAWKIESAWDCAIFTRQKTYIEHVVINEKNEECNYYNIKCAGMPDRSKKLFDYSMCGITVDDLDKDEVKKLKPDHIDFIYKKRTIHNFKVGLKVPAKLMPKRIKGGIVLQESWYEIR